MSLRTALSRRGALALGLAATLSMAAPAMAQEKASVALLAFVSSSPVFIAYEKGYFKAEGLDVELKVLKAAQPVVTAVASGDADFAVTAFTAGFFNLAGKGALKVVAGQAYERKGYAASVILASSKAHAAGLTSVEKIPGHSFGMTQVGSSFHYMLGRVLESKGQKISDVQMRPLQSIPNMMAAFKSAQVDVMITPPHLAPGLIASGEGKSIGIVSDFMNYQLGGVFTSTSHVEKRRAFVEKFVRAYQKGCQDFTEALMTKGPDGKYVYGPKAEEILKILDKHIDELKGDAIKAAAFYIDPQARLDPADIAGQVKWYQENGQVDASVDPKTFVDTSFVPTMGQGG